MLLEKEDDSGDGGAPKPYRSEDSTALVVLFAEFQVINLQEDCKVIEKDDD